MTGIYYRVGLDWAQRVGTRLPLVGHPAVRYARSPRVGGIWMIHFCAPRPQPVLKKDRVGHVSKNLDVHHLRR